MNKLLNYIRRRKLNQLIPPPNKAFPGYTKLRKVALIFSLEEVTKLNIEGWLHCWPRDVELYPLAWSSARRKELSPPLPAPVISREDWDIWNFPRGRDWDQFRHENYDLCIDLFVGHNPDWNWMRPQINTAFYVKVGGPEYSQAHLWLRKAPGEPSTIAELMKYLTLINK